MRDAHIDHILGEPMYAVIETGGKQYRVEFGTEIEVEHLEVDAGQIIDLDRILLVADGDQATIGSPLVDGALVRADVLRQDRGEKLIVFKYKPKARRRVKKGHRQELTVLRISEISLNGRSAADDAAKAQADERQARQQREEEASRQATADQALAAKLAADAAAKAEAETVEAPAKKTRARGARSTSTAAPAAEPVTIETAGSAATNEPVPEDAADQADDDALAAAEVAAAQEAIAVDQAVLPGDETLASPGGDIAARDTDDTDDTDDTHDAHDTADPDAPRKDE